MCVSRNTAKTPKRHTIVAADRALKMICANSYRGCWVVCAEASSAARSCIPLPGGARTDSGFEDTVPWLGAGAAPGVRNARLRN